MSVWAVSVVRDEADILPSTLDNLICEGVQGFVLEDHASVDWTPHLLSQFARTARLAGLTVILERRLEPGFAQGPLITRLAGIAGECGADWIIPFDADEHWRGTRATSLEETCRRSVDADVLLATTREILPDGRRAAEPKRLPKVAFRWRPGATVAAGNHSVTGVGGRTVAGRLEIDEYQYRSLEQLTRKVRQGAAALDAAGEPADTGSHWRELARLDDEGLRQAWLAMGGSLP